MHGPACIFWANLTPLSLHSLRNSSGQTGQQLAECGGHTAVVERVAAVAAEQLYQAAAQDDAAAIARLLAAGADPNAKAPK